MNLPAFLNQIDDLTASSDHNQLSSFLHDYARTLPENQRDAFLSRLQSSVNGKQTSEDTVFSVSDDVKLCMKRLREINENEEMCLGSEYNEDYDDWYNPDDDEIFFEDPYQILNTIDQAFDLVHTCLDVEEYQDSYDLSLLLSEVSVRVTGDYDTEPMKLADLSIYKLIDDNSYDRFPAEAAYHAYMASVPFKRAETICHLLNNLEWHHFSLEGMMQIGDHDLPDFETFLPSWIETLSSYEHYSTTRLLKEAMSMVKPSRQLDYADKFSDKHPELYLYILETHLKDTGCAETMMNAGINALNHIPVKYAIRSNIALLTAEYAVLQNNEMIREKACLEAFRSHCSLENYLRLRLECSDKDQYRKESRSIYESLHQTESHAYYEPVSLSTMDPLKENSLGDKEYDALLFFDERFSELLVLTHPKQSLGWSSTFLKQETALFLLLVQDYETLPKGMRSMLDIARSGWGIREETYFQGVSGKHTVSDDQLFESLFFRWKKEVHLNNDIRKEIMHKTGRLIDFRVNGIMAAEKRNYYAECAAFLAAYGEAEEFFGKKNAKRDLLESWRSRYPRRSSFTGPLKSYL